MGRVRHPAFLAESPLVFPTEDMLANLHPYKVLSQEEERTWADLFSVVLNG